MYCDFCGSKLSYQVRYCHKCGRQRRDTSGDTQPIPVIDDTILRSTKPQALGSTPWYKLVLNRRTATQRSKVGRTMYYLASMAIIGCVVYILTIFKTVKEYQILTGCLGGFWALYIWWKR